jgi:hypothetical protein
MGSWMMNNELILFRIWVQVSSECCRSASLGVHPPVRLLEKGGNGLARRVCVGRRKCFVHWRRVI